MMPVYIKDKAGKFRGSVPHTDTVPIALPALPDKPQEKQIQSVRYPLDDISRWDLSTAHEIDLGQQETTFESERDKKRATYISGGAFLGIQAGYIVSVTSMPSLGMPPTATAVIAALSLPIVIALASLPGKEYLRAKKAEVIKPNRD